jgi:hypothetical protein
MSPLGTVTQQDRVLAFNSKRTQEWMKVNLPEVWEWEIWPPRVCNPLDYFVWGIAELQINKASYNTTDSLSAR